MCPFFLKELYKQPFNIENHNEIFFKKHSLSDKEVRLDQQSTFLSKLLPIVFKKFQISFKICNFDEPPFTLTNLKFHFDCDVIISMPQTLKLQSINAILKKTNLSDWYHIIKSSIGYWDYQLITDCRILKEIFLKHLFDSHSSFFLDFFKLPTSKFTTDIFNLLKTQFIQYPNLKLNFTKSNTVELKISNNVHGDLIKNRQSNLYFQYKNDKVVIIGVRTNMLKLLVFDSDGNCETSIDYNNCSIMFDYHFFYVTVNDSKTYKLTRATIVDFLMHNLVEKNYELPSLIVGEKPTCYHDLNDSPRFSFLKSSTQLIIMSKQMKVEFELNLTNIPYSKISFCKKSIVFLSKTDDHLFSFSYLDVENLDFKQNIYSFKLSDLKVFNFQVKKKNWSCETPKFEREYATRHYMTDDYNMYCNYEGNKIVLLMEVFDALNQEPRGIILVFEKNDSDLKFVASKYYCFNSNYSSGTNNCYLYNQFDLTDSQFLYFKFDKLFTYNILNLTTYDIINTNDIFPELYEIVSVLDSNKLLVLHDPNTLFTTRPRKKLRQTFKNITTDNLINYSFRTKMYSCTSQHINKIRIIKN